MREIPQELLISVLQKASREVSAAACQLLAHLLPRWANDEGRRWNQSEISRELGRSWNTITAARAELESAEILEIRASGFWFLKIAEKSDSSSSSCFDQRGCGGGLPPSETEHLTARLMKEAELNLSQALTIVEQVDPLIIVQSLENLPAWRDYDQVRPESEKIRSWAGWFFHCVVKGGLRKVCQRVLRAMAGEETEAEKVRAREVSASPRWAGSGSDTSGRRIGAGLHRQEREAELAAKEALETEMEGCFQRLWPKLTQEEQEQVRWAARDEIPMFMLAKIDNIEESGPFRAVVRGKALELYGERLKTELSSLKLSTALGGTRLFSGARKARSPVEADSS